MAEIYLAGGCFWGSEKYLSLINGVTNTSVGYANGNSINPTYEQVCSGSGHAETVRVEYDPSVLPLCILLDIYYESVNPFSINRQGGDNGIQYRTGIYYTDSVDREIIMNSLKALQNRLGKPIAIECIPLENYYPAEQYHQKYLDKNPNGYCHIGKDKFKLAAERNKKQ